MTVSFEPVTESKSGKGIESFHDDPFTGHILLTMDNHTAAGKSCNDDHHQDRQDQTANH